MIEKPSNLEAICICEFGPMLGDGRMDSSRCPVHDMTHAELLEYAAMGWIEVTALEAGLARLRELVEKPMKLEFGQGRVLIALYSTDGPDGIVDGVAFRLEEIAHQINEADPTVNGISIEEFNPSLKFHFSRATSVQVLIDMLEVVRAALKQLEEQP